MVSNLLSKSVADFPLAIKVRLSLESCAADDCAHMGILERDYRSGTNREQFLNRVSADYMMPIPAHLHLVYTSPEGKQVVASCRLIANDEKTERLVRLLVNYWDCSERKVMEPCKENPGDAELSQEAKEAVAILKARINNNLSE